MGAEKDRRHRAEMTLLTFNAPAPRGATVVELEQMVGALLAAYAEGRRDMCQAAIDTVSHLREGETCQTRRCSICEDVAEIRAACMDHSDPRVWRK